MENFKMDDFTMPSELKVGDVVKGIVVQVEKKHNLFRCSKLYWR